MWMPGEPLVEVVEGVDAPAHMVIPFVDGGGTAPLRPQAMGAAEAGNAAAHDDDFSGLALRMDPARHQAGGGHGGSRHSRGLEELAASLTRFLGAFCAHLGDFIDGRAGGARLDTDRLRLAEHFRQMRAIGRSQVLQFAHFGLLRPAGPEVQANLHFLEIFQGPENRKPFCDLMSGREHTLVRNARYYPTSWRQLTRRKYK